MARAQNPYDPSRALRKTACSVELSSDRQKLLAFRSLEGPLGAESTVSSESEKLGKSCSLRRS